jgi:plasmid stability protein
MSNRSKGRERVARLVIRDLDEEVKRRLCERALRRGRSMEEEVRDILQVAAQEEIATSEMPLGSRIARRFTGLGLTEDLEPLAAPVKLRFDPAV